MLEQRRRSKCRVMRRGEAERTWDSNLRLRQSDSKVEEIVRET